MIGIKATEKNDISVAARLHFTPSLYLEHYIYHEPAKTQRKHAPKPHYTGIHKWYPRAFKEPYGKTLHGVISNIRKAIKTQRTEYKKQFKLDMVYNYKNLISPHACT